MHSGDKSFRVTFYAAPPLVLPRFPVSSHKPGVLELPILPGHCPRSVTRTWSFSWVPAWTRPPSSSQNTWRRLRGKSQAECLIRMGEKECTAFRQSIGVGPTSTTFHPSKFSRECPLSHWIAVREFEIGCVAVPFNLQRLARRVQVGQAADC